MYQSSTKGKTCLINWLLRLFRKIRICSKIRKGTKKKVRKYHSILSIWELSSSHWKKDYNENINRKCFKWLKCRSQIRLEMKWLTLKAKVGKDLVQFCLRTDTKLLKKKQIWFYAFSRVKWSSVACNWFNHLLPFR